MKNLILIIIVIHSVLACTKVIHKNIIDIQSIIEKSNNHIQKYKQSLNNNVDLEPSESAIEDNILQYLTVSSDDIKRYEGSLYSIQKLYYDFKGKDTDFYIRKIYMQKAQHLLKEVECFEKDFIYNCKLLKQKETIAYYKTKDFLMENLNSYGKMMGEYMGDVKLKMQYLAAFFLEIDLIDCLDACEEMSQKCDNIHADAKRKFEKMIKRALLAKNSFDEDQDEKHNNTEQNDTKATSDLSKVSNAQLKLYFFCYTDDLWK